MDLPTRLGSIPAWLALALSAGGFFAVAHAQSTSEPASGERVVLYEENPLSAKGSLFLGTILWLTEPVEKQLSEIAIRADIAVPSRGIAVTFRMQRNTDKALTASHTIELQFSLDQKFPFQRINNVPGILMKTGEQTRGSPLAGLSVKASTGYFLVGLSSKPSDLRQNLELLRTRDWIDIPMVYGNGRRAVLAVSKGTSGVGAFAKAFEAWQLPYYAFKEQCERLGKPVIGMSRIQAESTCWGQPLSTEKTTTASGTVERLLYPQDNYLQFENEKLVVIGERD
jgi:hypothetical protein